MIPQKRFGFIETVFYNKKLLQQNISDPPSLLSQQSSQLHGNPKRKLFLENIYILRGKNKLLFQIY